MKMKHIVVYFFALTATACGQDKPDLVLEERVEECISSEGVSEKGYYSEEAAICIAHVNGLPQGLEEWSTDLVYHFGFETMVWNVSNVESIRNDIVQGSAYSFDAITGENLDKSSYLITP